MADLVAALVALLQADTALAAITQGRVFGGELPEGEGEAMPRAALVVVPSGGTSLTAGSYAEHDSQRIDLFAYAGTVRAADALRREADRVLRQVRRSTIGGVLVHWVQSAGGSITGRDPDAAWPRTFQSYQVFHALQAID